MELQFTTKQELLKDISKVQDSLDKFKDSTKNDINELKYKVKTTEVEGTGIELFGVGSLVYGLLLSSIPQIFSI